MKPSQRCVDRIECVGEDVPQEEHENPGGERVEHHAQPRERRPQPSDGKSKEDRSSRDESEHEWVRLIHFTTSLRSP